jgi:non-heme chloroperoxidase
MRTTLLAALLAFAAAPVGAQTSLSPEDPSPHRVLSIAVSPEVRLEVLDWGGSGVPLVFLAGGGNTAHVFDEFAPRFTGEYRVLGITRRGYGASTVPEGGFDPRTRAADVVAVLDSLGVEVAVLVGHSFGGDELSRVAIEHPRRVRALVYLDAVDYGPDFLEMLGAFPDLPMPVAEMTAADSVSLAALIDFRERQMGVRYPAGETLAQATFGPDGRFTGYRPRADRQVMETMENAALSGIRVPALGIHSRLTSAEEYFADEWGGFDDGARERAREFFAVSEQWNSGVLRRFEDQVAGYERVDLPRAHHYFFITQSEVTARLMREFLGRALGS